MNTVKGAGAMSKEANKARERRSVKQAANKGNLPVDGDHRTSSYVADFFVDGKMISQYELHDRLVLEQELEHFPGVTPNKVQKQVWL
jgi:hypothetical protein